MKLPVFEGAVEALERHNERRKRRLEEAKCTPQKKRRIQLKKKRTAEATDRIKWSKKHGHDTYFGGSDVEMASDSNGGVNQKKGKGRSDSKGKCAACGSSTHQRSSHRDCPFHKDRAKKEALSVSPSDRSTRAASESGNESLGGPSDSGMSDEVEIDICTCGTEGRAHKRGCPLSLRNHKPGGRTLFPACDSGALAVPGVPCSPKRHTPAPVEVVKPEVKDVKPITNVGKPEFTVGDYVCIHGRNMGDFHVSCRIVGEIAGRYQLYCLKGVLNTSFSSTEFTPLTSFSPIPLDEWRWAPKVSPHFLALSSLP